MAVLQTRGPAVTLLSRTGLSPASAGSVLANAGLSGTVTLSTIVDDVGGGVISQDLALVDVGSCNVVGGRERFLKHNPWLAAPF